MDAPFNPVSTSGIGFRLEHYVQASYLASLILGTPHPFENELSVKELVFQGKLVANTDDVIVKFSDDKKTLTHYVQSKKGFEINTDKVFHKVIEALWNDFNKKGFDRENSKFIITTDVLSKPDIEDGLLVLEWARFSKDANDFTKKIRSNKTKLAKYKYFSKAIEKANNGQADQERIWGLLKLIYIKAYDYLEAGSKDKEVLKWFLKPFLRNENNPENALLVLMDYVETYNQHGATIDILNVASQIKELFDLAKSPRIGPELREFLKKSRSQLQFGIQYDIEGLHIDRTDYILKISELVSEKNIVFISGEGGVGKSGLAREYIEQLYKSEGGYIVFKADQLDRSSLSQTLSDSGIHSDLETLLSQWILLPKLVIYIDSFEKLHQTKHKEAFLELLGKIKGLDHIKIIATCRGFAIETLRQKFRLPKKDIAILPLFPLSDEQLKEIAEKKPLLRKIIENPRLKELITLPFYLDWASQIVESITNEEGIDESEFKKLLWEYIIEKKGDVSLGEGKKRAEVFSSITIKRAKEKLPFVKPDLPIDHNIISELETGGLLLKHPKIDAYAPKHDIFEDMVIINHLNEFFHRKINGIQFLTSIDNNPVFRRALRLWIQELIIQQPDEAKIFLGEIFPHYTDSGSIIDEILIGILGSKQSYELIKQNNELFLKNNCILFLRSFHLLKVAYVLPYEGEHPERKLKTTGDGWTALLKILDENYSKEKTFFDVLLKDLLYHWTLQYDPDDILPAEAEIVAKYCFQLLEADKELYRFDAKRRILEMLFSVAPFAKDAIECLIKDAIISKKEDKSDGVIRIRFYGDLFEMLLVETFRCINVYKLVPELIIELARMEWYKNKIAEDHEADYQESSFGLVEYPYKYFSASSYQTPFRYLFRYHPKPALDFFIELCNRGMKFYLKTFYATQNQTMKVQMVLEDETVVMQLGDAGLWDTYRGYGQAPYLVQSALMAFEAHLLEGAASDILEPELFDNIIKKSDSVLLTAVLASVALAYPLVFREKVFALFKVKEFFRWDLGRYSHDMMSSHHTTIGNDLYYTRERYLSNGLKHRKNNLEHLVSKLQFYYPEFINDIIDQHKGGADVDEHGWQLALVRMDMRNTIPEIREEEEIIVFNPKPLPENLQDFVDDGQEVRIQDTNAISIYLWTDKALKNETTISYAEWKEIFEKLKKIDFRITYITMNPSKNFAALGIREFLSELTQEEKQYCVSEFTSDLKKTNEQLKAGYSHSAVDIFNETNLSILPILLNNGLKSIIDYSFIKSIIFDFLILLTPDSKKHLINGIRIYAWKIDEVLAQEFFQTVVKISKNSTIYRELHQARTLQGFTIEKADEILSSLKETPDIKSTDIDLNSDDPNILIQALQMLPYSLINSDHRDYLNQILSQINDLGDLRDYHKLEFIRSLQNLIATTLLENADKNSLDILSRLLSLKDGQFNFVLETLKHLIWEGHDRQYPEHLWFHLNFIFDHVISQSPTVGYVHILLFEPLPNPERCYKLVQNGSGKKLHEIIISEFAADRNLIEAVFKLLAGVGTVYQPLCLTWLMKSLPNRKSYTDNLIIVNIYPIERFVQQLYETHIDHIRVNKEQMEYFIMLLNIIIDRGSTIAFRIRDEVI